MRFCSLGSGSNGNCHYVESAGSCVLIDIGLSAKKTEENMRASGLDPARPEAILLTHEHIDHVAGVAVWIKRYRIPLYATEGTWQGLGPAAERIPPELVHLIRDDERFSIGDLTVQTLPTCHDAADPVGYLLRDAHASCAVVTDTGALTEELEEGLAEANLAVIESNHDLAMLMNGPYPMPLKRRVRGNLGHLSNDDCAKALASLLAKRPDGRYLLGHLSEVNNTPEIALRTAVETVGERLGAGYEKQILLTHRGLPTKVLEL